MQPFFPYSSANVSSFCFQNTDKRGFCGLGLCSVCGSFIVLGEPEAKRHSIARELSRMKGRNAPNTKVAVRKVSKRYALLNPTLVTQLQIDGLQFPSNPCSCNRYVALQLLMNRSTNCKSKRPLCDETCHGK